MFRIGLSNDSTGHAGSTSMFCWAVGMVEFSCSSIPRIKLSSLPQQGVTIIITLMKSLFVIDALDHIDKEITLFGWADTIRDHKKVIFIDLRDVTGKIQCVAFGAVADKARGLTPESVLKVKGKINKRSEGMINDNIPTGTIELAIEEFDVVTKSKPLPLPIDSDGYSINEETRNEYRYLDLRRERMARNIQLRGETLAFIRKYLSGQRFTEVETPILTKTSPEGARDFIVPSRLQPGKFYALPQSPQQYKQLLMVAGIERYFQIARCFRDEDPRADRAYGEFTQLDIEMSFVHQEDILSLAEDMFTKLVKEVFSEKKISKAPWPRIPHKEAMEKYGSDKPDLRENPDDPNELAFAWVLDFPLFAEQSDDDYYHGSGAAKFAPSHHMFTAPHPDDIDLLESDPMKVRGIQHDLVLNGLEVGGGSIRIHDADVQSKVFDLIGFSDEQKSRFADILEAFQYGVPPHGGIAPGVDRFLMAVLGEPSVREVMAFPTSSSGKVSVMDAPSVVEDDQLKQLGVTVNAESES